MKSDVNTVICLPIYEIQQRGWTDRTTDPLCGCCPSQSGSALASVCLASILICVSSSTCSYNGVDGVCSRALEPRTLGPEEQGTQGSFVQVAEKKKKANLFMFVLSSDT